MGLFQPELSGQPSGDSEKILFIHGLLMGNWCFAAIAHRMEKNGFGPFFYDYPTRRYVLAEHGRMLAEILEKESPSYFHVITHSMGGLLLRSALSLHPELKERIGRCVLIAPPNHGSPSASYFLERISFAPKLVTSLPDLSHRPEAAVRRLAGLDGVHFAVIAAGKDKRVSRRSTHLAGEEDHIIIPGVSHTGVLFRRQTAKLCAVTSGKGNSEFGRICSKKRKKDRKIPVLECCSNPGYLSGRI